MSDREYVIIAEELGGIDSREAEAVVDMLDREIRIWTAMQDEPDTTNKDREKYAGFVANYQRRRRLWAELAALDDHAQEQYERGQASA